MCLKIKVNFFNKLTKILLIASNNELSSKRNIESKDCGRDIQIFEVINVETLKTANLNLKKNILTQDEK